MTPDGKLKTGIAILVNGRNINFLQGLNTSLVPGDKVTIIPPAAGG
jgi:molybdopterin converting factor small subunit